MERTGYRPFYELSDPMIERMLSLFYHDRKRWAFTLQILFLTSRYEQILEASRIERAVLDRSIFGDVIFARMLAHYGDMGDHELEVYERLYSSLIRSVQPPLLMVYVRISTDLAVERIRRRGREYELVVEREYWERLNAEYEDYFRRYDLSPLLIINADDHEWVSEDGDGDLVVSKILDVLDRSRRGLLKAGTVIEI